MSTDNSPNATTQGATLRVGDVLLGGMVFFKVEEGIFEVPRHRFTQYSEVFADMFLVPQAEGAHDVVNVEGRDKEHPIVLEGYKAADFAALVKILYPSPEDVISGSYTLGKQEWAGVLNLSTRWQMEMLRDLAITKLSSLSLTSLEKVTLARAHKVATWLKEGLSEIVKQEETLQPDELEAHLGLRTAFRLMWIQNQSLKRLSASSITMRSLGCPNGHVMFSGVQSCHNCSRQIVLDDPDAMYVTPGSVIPTQGSSISLQILRCKHCSGLPRTLTAYYCPSCGYNMHYSSFISLAPPPTPNTNADTVAVEEQFKEEIATYESWDQ